MAVHKFQVLSGRVATGLAVAALSVGAMPAYGQTSKDNIQRSVQFETVSPARTSDEKRNVRSTDSMTIVDGDTKRQIPIEFNTILRSGQRAGQYPFGALVDESGKPVLAADGSMTIADSNDFSSLLRHNDQMFMVSHFESRPGAMYVTKLDQDAETGQLSAISTRPIDFSDVDGLWTPCAGSVTPWGTHLGGEEYEPNARAIDVSTGSIDGYYNAMGAYITGSYPTQEQGLTELNPYDYGWPTEISITDSDGDVAVNKHYAMGRKANELAYVMPDERTVYNTDDGTNVGLYMFVADEEDDLSAGTLYAMKWNQTGATAGGAADLDWINLGHATDDEIAGYLGRDGSPALTFADIFETAEPADSGEICPSGFTSINTNGYGPECLRVKPGMDKAASRLETRRYAAIQGATIELRKEEGFTFDPTEDKFYVAISERERGMEDFARDGNSSDVYDRGTSNDIRLSHNVCGTVYSGDVAAGSDSAGTAINSRYVARNIAGEVSGTMIADVEPGSSDIIDYIDPSTSARVGADEPGNTVGYVAGSGLENNVCDINGIANPDNITFMPGYHTLIIGEDSSQGHQNDMVWAYNTQTKDLTRIETTPFGSESTSIYFYPDMNGFGYLMSVVQHPYGESDQGKLQTADQAQGYTGYIGPFPALDVSTHNNDARQASAIDDATPNAS